MSKSWQPIKRVIDEHLPPLEDCVRKLLEEDQAA